MSFFQIGFEQEADVAESGVSLGGLRLEDVEPRGLLASPPGAGPLEHRVGDLDVTADHPCVEQSEGHPEILRGDGQDFVRSADAVIEGDSLVPHRVPDSIGQGSHVLSSAVNEEHVEIAEGAEPAPSVPADGDERHPARVALCRLIEQSGQPRVGLGRVRAAKGISDQVGTLDERLAPITQRHGRTVPPGTAGPIAPPRANHGSDLGIIVVAMADDDRTGLTFFDGVLIAGGGLIAILVAFWVFRRGRRVLLGSGEDRHRAGDHRPARTDAPSPPFLTAGAPAQSIIER